MDGWMRKARKGWWSRERGGEGGGGEGVLPLVGFVISLFKSIMRMEDKTIEMHVKQLFFHAENRFRRRYNWD